MQALCRLSKNGWDLFMPSKNQGFAPHIVKKSCFQALFFCVVEKKNLTLFHSSRKNTHRKMSWNSFFLSFYVPFCMIHFKISQRCWAWQWVPPATAMEVQGTQVEHLLVISKLICFFFEGGKGKDDPHWLEWCGVWVPTHLGAVCSVVWGLLSARGEDAARNRLQVTLMAGFIVSETALPLESPFQL